MPKSVKKKCHDLSHMILDTQQMEGDISYAIMQRFYASNRRDFLKIYFNSKNKENKY